jgi:hypothetical protein
MLASIVASQRSRLISVKLPGEGPALLLTRMFGRGTRREQQCLTVRGRDIGRDRGHIAAGSLAQLGSRLVEFCRVAPVDDDVDTFLRQGLRARPAPALGWTRKRGRCGLRSPDSCFSLPEIG